MDVTKFCSNWEQLLIEIDSTCRSFDSTWQKRRRIVDTKIVVLFILQLFNGRELKNYSTALSNVWLFFKGKNSAKPRKLEPVVASTICDARQKIDESIFVLLNKKVLDVFESQATLEQRLWRGLTLFAVDGSKVNLPAITADLGFDVISKDKARPQGLLSCLYNVTQQVPVDFMLESHGDERLCALDHLKKCPLNSLVIYDRGYMSYQLLKEHSDRGIFGLFRIQKGSFAVFQEFIDDPNSPTDQIVEVIPTRQSQKDIKSKNGVVDFYPIKVRLMRYSIAEKQYYLATTLLDSDIEVDEFARNYHGRWAIEELYKKSKSILNMESFHSKTLRGIRQEIFASLFLVTLTRILTTQGESMHLSECSNDKKKALRKAKPHWKKAIRHFKSISNRH